MATSGNEQSNAPAPDKERLLPPRAEGDGASANGSSVRNLRSLVGEDAKLSNWADYDRQARAFFRWLDACVEEILALPAYQRVKQEDSAFEPSAGELDPLILPAVEALKRIPGDSTQFSCQGVSGKVRFQGREPLVPKHHQRSHSRQLRAGIGTALDGRQPPLPPRAGRTGRARASERGQLEHTSQRAWLCQPERIERTLRLLFSLNYWARARERLPYADSQGLYLVKAEVVRQTFAVGLLSLVSYIDGSSGFARGFSLHLAADIATEVFLDRLAWLLADDEYLPADGQESDSTVLSLFARIMGRQATSGADIEALDVEWAKAFLLDQEPPLSGLVRCRRERDGPARSRRAEPGRV